MSEPLGLLSNFIVDIDPDCTKTLIVVRHALKDGKLNALFEGLLNNDETTRSDFFRALRDRIPLLFTTTIEVAGQIRTTL